MSKGIYCYINKEKNEVVYIGRDSNIDKHKRHRAHFASLRHDEQQINRVLQNNPDRYIYQVLWEIDDCTDNHLNQMEIFYIRKYNPQLNFTKGGGGMTGYKHSLEARKKISESKQNKSRSEKTKKKISENNARYWDGKKLSEEHKKNISKTQNKTGFFRVFKAKRTDYQQGFAWSYQYFIDKGKQRKFIRANLVELEKEAKKRGLDWYIVDAKLATKSLEENRRWSDER